MKKVLALCFVILMSAFLLTACIVINNDKGDTTAVTTTMEETTTAAGEETTGEEAQTTAAGAGDTTAAASTTKAPGTTIKIPVTVTTTKKVVIVTTTKPVITGTCKNWPVNNVTKLVPKPTFGEVVSSDLDGKEAHVFIKYNSHPSNFNTYVSALKNAGYTNIQEDYSTSFKAKNSDGVTVQLYPSKFPPIFGTINVYVLEIMAV